jgi:hypothetical protein
MTALADFPVAQAGPRAWRGPGNRGLGPAAIPGAVPAAEPGIEHARNIAREIAGAGQRVSRRALRSRGVRGSNEALNALALTLSAQLANGTASLP